MIFRMVIYFILLLWSGFTFSNNSAVFRYVNIYTSNYTNNSSIYSNGTMQAKIIIDYELSEDYLIQDVKLLKYEGGELSNFKFFENENNYPHEIESLKSSGVVLLARSDKQYQNFYLATSSTGVTRICAKLSALNTRNSQIEYYSTCNNSDKQSYVTLRALQPKRYTINDFTVISEEIDWYDGFMRFKTYELIPKGWLLSRVISNGSSIEVYNSSQVATHQLSHFFQYMDVDSSLTLYRHINKNQQDMYVPAWALAPHKEVEKLSDKYKFQVNTNNKINLVRSYGFKIKDKNGDYGILAKNPQYGQDIRYITFYDNYGNEGIIYVKRVNDIDKIYGGNLENMDYGFY
ncbi:hypothetical protein AB7W30_12380 [Providencia manganoxydans]|uniref:hypothetical protein n=1 Tax=Providencia manganoxydans TaxID=2923283 RepID=UPI0032DA10D8